MGSMNQNYMRSVLVIVVLAVVAVIGIKFLSIGQKQQATSIDSGVAVPLSPEQNGNAMVPERSDSNADGFNRADTIDQPLILEDGRVPSDAKDTEIKDSGVKNDGGTNGSTNGGTTGGTPKEVTNDVATGGRVWDINALENSGNTKANSDKPVSPSGSGIYILGGDRIDPIAAQSSSVANDIWKGVGTLGIAWNPAPISQFGVASVWSKRDYFSSFYYKNALWVMGGNANFPKHDIWNSTDYGLTWNHVDTDANSLNGIQDATWSARQNFQVVNNNGTLYLTGGTTTTCLTSVLASNQMWASNDAIHWSLVSSGPWSGRYGHASVSYNGEIYVLGGVNCSSGSTMSNNEIWKFSPSTQKWTHVVTSGPMWSPRFNHSAVVMDGKIWVLGGADTTSSYNDSWYSENGGVSWHQMAKIGGSGTWAPRSEFQTPLIGGKILYVMGGNSSSYGSGMLGDVWHATNINYSTNTMSWVQDPVPPWSARTGFQAVVVQ